MDSSNRLLVQVSLVGFGIGLLVVCGLVWLGMWMERKVIPQPDTQLQTDLNAARDSMRAMIDSLEKRKTDTIYITEKKYIYLDREEKRKQINEADSSTIDPVYRDAMDYLHRLRAN